MDESRKYSILSLYHQRLLELQARPLKMLKSTMGTFLAHQNRVTPQRVTQMSQTDPELRNISSD